MPVRRLKKTPAHLEITAFINLIVVLVPFLLSMAVFTHLAVIDLSLPAQSNDAGRRSSIPTSRSSSRSSCGANRIEVGDKHRRRAARIAVPEPGDRARHPRRLGAAAGRSS